MDPCTIFEGCLAGKTRCQKLFYERFYGYALKIAFRYIQNKDEAEVLVNDSFAKMLFDRDVFRFQNKSDIETTVKNSVKKIIVYRAIDKLFSEPITYNSACNPANNISFGASDKDANKFYGKLISLLGSLPLWHCILFNMHVIDGFSLLDIASHFETSVSACLSDLADAKSVLRKMMDREESFSQSVGISMLIAR